MTMQNCFIKSLRSNKTCILNVARSFAAADDHNTQDAPSSTSPLKPYKDVSQLLNNSLPLDENQREEGVFATTAYPQGTVFQRGGQSRHSLRPKCDPATTSIILFPGQGTQFVGMGMELLKFPVAKQLFEAASEILQYDLISVCRNGPIEKLSQTKYCQPAVVVSSLAAVERLKEECPEALNNCIATAGFSVGEISALVFAGSIDFERAIKLLKVRAEAMQYCSEMTPSGMLTILIGADSKVSEACRDAIEHCTKLNIESPVCTVASYLYPSAKVIAGHLEALNFVTENSKKYNIRKVSRLNVSGAFHTTLMKPAADAIYAALKKANINDPIVSVHRNIDGKRYSDAGSILRSFPGQVWKPVKWEQTMHVLYERSVDEDFPKTFECGPGKSLITLLNKVNAKAALAAKNIQS